MPSLIAKRKCPELIFVAPRFEVYRAISLQIRAIFAEYTPIVEPLNRSVPKTPFQPTCSPNDAAREALQDIIDKVWEHGGRSGSHGRTVTLKVKFANFQQITRSRTGQTQISTRGDPILHRLVDWFTGLPGCNAPPGRRGRCRMRCTLRASRAPAGTWRCEPIFSSTGAPRGPCLSMSISHQAQGSKPSRVFMLSLFASPSSG
jgi:hypothetical protein